MPSSTVLISGPALGAAQILIWSYSCVFLPPMSTAIRTRAFSCVGALHDFYIFHRHRDCLIDCVDLICSLYGWWEGFGSSSLATLPLGFFYFHLFVWVVLWGLLLRLPWRTWVCPCEGQEWRWCSCLGHRGSGSTRFSGELVARAAGNTVLQRVWQPVMANSLQCSCLENPPPWQRSLAGHSLQGHKESDRTEEILCV